MHKIENRIVYLTDNIISSLKKMDVEKTKILFAFSNGHFEGVLTIGDIQRAILNNVALTEPIHKILDSCKVYASLGEALDSIKAKMYKLRAECMPVVDENGELIEVYFWNDFSKVTRTCPSSHLVFR